MRVKSRKVVKTAAARSGEAARLSGRGACAFATAPETRKAAVIRTCLPTDLLNSGYVGATGREAGRLSRVVLTTTGPRERVRARAIA